MLTQRDIEFVARGAYEHEAAAAGDTPDWYALPEPERAIWRRRAAWFGAEAERITLLRLQAAHANALHTALGNPLEPFLADVGGG